jgi:hypothetical protein
VLAASSPIPVKYIIFTGVNLTGGNGENRGIWLGEDFGEIF